MCRKLQSIDFTFRQIQQLHKNDPAAALPLGGGNGAVTLFPFAFDEVGLLHRENAVPVSQINAKIPHVK